MHTRSISPNYQFFAVMKYNEQLNIWNEKNLYIEEGKIIFFDKKSDIYTNNRKLSKSKTFYYLDNVQVRKFKTYTFTKAKKTNVIHLQFLSGKAPEYVVYISLKNESLMNTCYDKIIKCIPNNSMQLSQSEKINIENISFSGENDLDYIGSNEKVISIEKDEEEVNEKDDIEKNTIANLFDLSIKKSTDQFKISNLTPIKPDGRNERYLHYDFDDNSLNEDNSNSNLFNISLHSDNNNNNNNKNNKNNISQKEKTPKEIEGNEEELSPTNCLNLFNLSLYPKNKIANITKEIESYHVFIYDSYLFKKIVKENKLSKREIGELYTTIQSPALKTQVLTEMIGGLSKRHLKQRLISSYENFELQIIEHFNCFLGKNTMNDNLFDKTLPGELNDVYGIEIIIDLNQRISKANLFIIMEYKSKIYFNDNMNINFNNCAPFVQEDIKYICPYIISKLLSINASNANSTNIITLTSFKRLPNALSPAYSSLKEFNINYDSARIELISSINNYIPSKKYEIALRLCDFYINAFYDSFFLNSLVYVIMSEIYNSTLGLKVAKEYFNKSVMILNWIYPDDNCHLICDCYYSFSLILMKQSSTYVLDNLEEIKGVIMQSLKYGKIFYEKTNREKFIKIELNFLFFQYTYGNCNDNNDKDLIVDLEEILNINRLEGELFAKMFMGVMKRKGNKVDSMSKIMQLLFAKN